MSTPIDTGKVARRPLRFGAVADAKREIEKIRAAYAVGRLKTKGNWTPAQVLNHLAAFIEYAYVGYPPALAKPPWMIRFILKFMKSRYLYKSMPVGVRIPGVPGGTLGAEEGDFARADARLVAALTRLEREAPVGPNPVFGPLTHAEWTNLHLRHCELHLAFLDPA
ncbi:MAG: DUF1569 domain-containing protein [Phycisphaerae bacterium]|nr:DUF1569 domain-containing protein [Phycisphaerae bacterium]